MQLKLYATEKYETVRELPRSVNILNVYQINILNNTTCSELPFGIIPFCSYVNIETMNIISSDVEITGNYFVGVKSIDLFAIAKGFRICKQFLGFVNHLKKQRKEKNIKIKEEFLKYKELNELE